MLASLIDAFAENASPKHTRTCRVPHSSCVLFVSSSRRRAPKDNMQRAQWRVASSGPSPGTFKEKKTGELPGEKKTNDQNTEETKQFSWLHENAQQHSKKRETKASRREKGLSPTNGFGFGFDSSAKAKDVAGGGFLPNMSG